MKILGIGGVVTAIVVALWMAWGFYVIFSTERPRYEVLQTINGDVEIRQYEEQTWISTSYQTDDASFRILASYIFGGNQQGEKIAMTAPVISDQQMSFVLPKGVSESNAPTPEGQEIEFKTVPPRKVATLQFSWFASHYRVEKKTAKLLEILRDNSIETSGQPFLMRYNDPWTPPFLRRNEVAVQIE